MLKDEVTKLQMRLLMAEEEAQQPKPMYMTNMSGSDYPNNQNMTQSNPFATNNLGVPGTKMSQNKDSPGKQQKPKSKLEELQLLRANLLNEGLYKGDEDMIIEIDCQIKRLERSPSPNRSARN